MAHLNLEKDSSGSQNGDRNDSTGSAFLMSFGVLPAVTLQQPTAAHVKVARSVLELRQGFQPKSVWGGFHEPKEGQAEVGQEHHRQGLQGV
jgi:hypothetical protein